MMKKLFYRSIDSVTAAAFLVAASSLLSRLLGVVRDRILAGSFGAGDTLDVYYAAFRIPDFIFNILVLGALSAGFIPIFARLAHENNDHNQKEAWRLANNILNLLGLLLIALLILGIIFAPLIMKLATPGFSGEKMAQTVMLTRIMFLSPLMLGISGVLGGILQSMKRFLAYSLSPLFYNLGIIFGAYFLAPHWGIVGLAWGVVLGSTMHALIQVPAVLNLGWRYQFVVNWRDKGVRMIIKMMTARTLALASNQINLLVVTIIASTLVSGSLAIFNLANNLQSFPIGIFGISFAIAVFPVLSVNAFNKEKLVARLSSSVRQILFFIIPSMVVFLLLRAQIVRLILGSGKFDWNDTVLTMNTLSLFAVSFFAQALIPLFTRVFYARHDSRTPFIISMSADVLNVGLAIWFSRLWGVTGLALAFSLSSILNFVALIVALKLELGSLNEKRTMLWVAKFTVAGLASAGVIQLIKSGMGVRVDMERFSGVLTQTALAVIAGAAVYLFICWLFGSPEVVRLWQYIKRRVPAGKIQPPADQGEARGI